MKRGTFMSKVDLGKLVEHQPRSTEFASADGVNSMIFPLSTVNTTPSTFFISSFKLEVIQI